MKKLLIVMSCLLLIACTEDQDKFEATVLVNAQKDQDLKDYNIDPERMTECIMDKTGKTAPGLFPFSPKRMTYYKAMSQLLSIKDSKDPAKTLAEAQAAFGTKKEAMQAFIKHSSNVMDCVSALTFQKTEEGDDS